MDSDELRAILTRSRVGIWALIDTAIKLAISDYDEELKHRRDKIVETLYASPSCNQLCQNCNSSLNDVVPDHYFSHINNNSSDNNNDNTNDKNKNRIVNSDNINEEFSKSPLTPESNNRNSTGEEEQEEEEEEELDPYGGLFDDEQTKILRFKEQLEDPNQSEESVAELLQNLADMDITFQALKETDIGRHVNGLRKHPSNEVRRLVKQLVRKWKETVDEWVKVNQPEASSNLIADGDSPQQNMSKNQQNGPSPGAGFRVLSKSTERVYESYSEICNGKSGAERNSSEYEPKPKPPQSFPRRETPSRPPQSVPKSASAPPNKPQREAVVDDERLNSARRRLQENYQEAQNAKKQRTIQVMDIHEIPKPRNGFISKNKGGGFQGRNHHR
ncbi:putative mediator of RNA polymerase II transcription subunit 26c [Abeliophyllum distichum]|uniref:Mediator of RNA polymerase II transcription subunit 26c n=1 Tax=Abeliophyllum distichum TaxID=126358 RepID=A0ABD1SD51_9LAMI